MYEIKHVHGLDRVHCEGVEVARCRTDTLVLSGAGEYPVLNGFYRQASDVLKAYALGAFGAAASQAYEASEERNKRFYFPVWEIELRSTVMQADEHILSVCLERRQGRRGSSERAIRLYAQTWHMESERLMPLSVVLRMSGIRSLSKRQKRCCGYYIEKGKIVLLHGREDGTVVRETIGEWKA